MIYNHPNYIQQQLPINFDHARVSKNGISFINPPKFTLDTKEWGNELEELAKAKLTELLDRYDFIENRFDNNSALIRTEYDHPEDFISEVLLSIEAYSASETIYLDKWIRYWRRIFDSVSKQKIIPQQELEKLSEYQIEQAKEFPIESMYVGDLRTISGKQIGLCPFHDEKTPSFTIFNDNKFHCFGCHVHGDAIDFWMKTRNVDFIQAVKDLLNE